MMHALASSQPIVRLKPVSLLFQMPEVQGAAPKLHILEVPTFFLDCTILGIATYDGTCEPGVHTLNKFELL